MDERKIDKKWMDMRVIHFLTLHALYNKKIKSIVMYMHAKYGIPLDKGNAIVDYLQKEKLAYYDGNYHLTGYGRTVYLEIGRLLYDHVN